MELADLPSEMREFSFYMPCLNADVLTYIVQSKREFVDGTPCFKSGWFHLASSVVVADE